MEGNGRRTAWGALAARLRGEVSADVLEAFRRAGSSVYDLVDDVEERRLMLRLEERSPWQFPSGFQAQLLCAWNAFVLQSLGDRLLLHDYEADPSSEGLVPPSTADQARRFYGSVHPWVLSARLAGSNREHRVSAPLPAQLPSWLEIPRPLRHLHVMSLTIRDLVLRCELVLSAYDADDERDDRRSTVGRMREMLAAIDADLDFGTQVLLRCPPELVHVTDVRLQSGLRTAHRLGQFLAMPGLLRIAELRRRGQRPLRARHGGDDDPGGSSALG